MPLQDRIRKAQEVRLGTEEVSVRKHRRMQRSEFYVFIELLKSSKVFRKCIIFLMRRSF